MIVSLAAEKGGVGKSTLAVNLAVWRASRGRKVLLVDGDRIQASASAWTTRRGSLGQGPSVACTMLEGDLIASQVKTFATLFDDVVIDGRGANDKGLLGSLLVADRCLTPMRPNQFDLLSMVNMGRAVEYAKTLNPGLKALAVISQAPTTDRGADAQEARKLIQKAVPEYRLLDVVVHSRKAWARCAGGGNSVLELPASEGIAAKQELEVLAKEVWE